MSARGFSLIRDGYSYFGYACDSCGHTETEWRKRGRTSGESMAVVNRLRGAIRRHVRDAHQSDAGEEEGQADG